jgi:hypothetical protein
MNTATSGTPNRSHDLLVPVNTPFKIVATNWEQWVRTVKVTIDGQSAAQLDIPAGPAKSTSGNYVSGKGTVSTGGKSNVSITVLDSQEGVMNLVSDASGPKTFGPLQIAGIFGEKDYQGEVDTWDMMVFIVWKTK